MGVRRVVTGHTADGVAVFVSDEEVPPTPFGEGGSQTTRLWGRDDVARFPDDGRPPPYEALFPPVGGTRWAVLELAPGADAQHHAVVRDGLAPWSDPDDAGMHRTATIDYDFVLEGTIGLELDDGAEVTLGPGDVVVQNGTRHRWHNRGEGVARLLAVVIGAHHAIEGGRRPDGR
jgi:mannose-6-phosphate isomerase-like protein (cupin superfamily)